MVDVYNLWVWFFEFWKFYVIYCNDQIRGIDKKPVFIVCMEQLVFWAISQFHLDVSTYSCHELNAGNAIVSK